MITRRWFLSGLAAGVAAPAIVQASALMPLRGVVLPFYTADLFDAADNLIKSIPLTPSCEWPFAIHFDGAPHDNIMVFKRAVITRGGAKALFQYDAHSEHPIFLNHGDSLRFTSPVGVVGWEGVEILPPDLKALFDRAYLLSRARSYHCNGHPIAGPDDRVQLFHV